MNCVKLLDVWEDGYSVGKHIATPNWEQLVNAIDSLVDYYAGAVVLYATDEEPPELTIQRDEDHFAVSYRDQQHEYYMVVNAEHENSQEEIEAFGATNYPLKFVVDQHTSLKIAKTFYETGEQDKTVKWGQW